MRFEFFDRDGATEFLRDGGDAVGADSAGDEPSEGLKVDVAIHGDAVHGDPFLELDANGANLSLLDPDAGVDVKPFAFEGDLAQP